MVVLNSFLPQILFLWTSVTLSTGSFSLSLLSFSCTLVSPSRFNILYTLSKELQKLAKFTIMHALMNLNFQSRNMGIKESHHSTSNCLVNISICLEFMLLTVLNFSSFHPNHCLFLCCLCQSVAPCCPGQKCQDSFCVLSLSDTRYLFTQKSSIKHFLCIVAEESA